MDQRTHAWIEIRAVELISRSIPELGSLLAPHVKSAALAACLPDLNDSKVGSGKTENHVFKMEPYPANGPQAARFTMSRAELLKNLGSARKVVSLLPPDGFGPGWWSAPYKADPDPGAHLANRVKALSV